MSFDGGSGGESFRIDRYQIVRRLGAGGSGTVYEALQDEPRRRVALKVVHDGASPSDLERVRYEADILARLNHPAIAQVHDAGRASLTGTYIAMELVEGARHIDEYVRAERLAVREIVALFVQVCEAVAHGHERGVIHRDLKPSNVLVDANGKPKVIDFGIARVLDAARAHATEVGRLVGTLAYMSPEQVDAESAVLDVRSDVYALGTMLFELITGATPFDFTSASLGEASRRLREDQPPRLRKLRPDADIEIEWIVAKALEKDPARRYANATSLASDLRAFLAHEEISASPPTTTYRLRVFTRRHRLALSVAIGVTVMLVVGSIAAWRDERRAVDLAARAEVAEQVATARAEEVAHELANQQEILDSQARWFATSHARRPGRDARFVDVLEGAARSLDESPPTDASVEAALRYSLCLSYNLIDAWEATYTQVGRTRDAVARGGALDARKLDSLSRIEIRSTQISGFKDRAFALATAFVEETRVRTGECSRSHGEALLALAAVEFSLLDYASSTPHYREALEILALHDADTAREARQGLVYSLMKQRSLDEAVSEGMTSVAEALASPRTPRYSILRSELALALALSAASQPARALEILLRIRPAYEELIGPDAFSICEIDRNISDAYFMLRSPGPALEWARRSFDGYTRVFGPDHPHTKGMRSRIAMQTLAVASIDEGCDLFDALLLECAEQDGPRSKAMLELQLMYGRALIDRRARLERALEILESAVELGRDIHAQQPLQQCLARHHLALVLILLRRPARASDLLTENLAVVDAEKGREDLDAVSALRALGDVAEMMNAPEESACWFRDLHARRLSREGAANPVAWGDAHRLAEALVRVGDAVDAGALAAVAIDAQRLSPKSDPITLGRLLLVRAQAAALTNDRTEAEFVFELAVVHAWTRLPETSIGVSVIESAYAEFLAANSEFERALSLAEVVLERKSARPAQRRECALVAAAAHAAAGRTDRELKMRELARSLGQ